MWLHTRHEIERTNKQHKKNENQQDGQINNERQSTVK